MPQEFRHHIETLRQRFIAGLLERAQHLDNLWSYLRHLNWSAQGFAALEQFVHKQQEAGSSYALPELRVAAEQLLTYLNELRAVQRHFGGQEYTQLEEQIKQLRRVMLAIAQGEGQQESLPAPIDPHHFPDAAGKILFLIDPDRPLASLCAAYLRRVGFVVEYFETPQQCLQTLYETTPDAILLDPDFERAGLQALSVVHSLKALLPPTTPVVLMSGRTDVNARLRALRAGSSDYLVKPLEMNLLIERLLQIITQNNRSYKVMIVDDDPDMIALESEILRYAGMEVLSVQQPLHSLQQAARFQPDLVILDMHMPDINGMELAVLLRQDPLFVLLPIVFVTADTDTRLHNNIKALGVNAVLTKPFEATQLIDTCQQALTQTSALKNRVARITRQTQLPQKINRSYFFSILEDELGSANSGEPSSALYYLALVEGATGDQPLGRVEQVNLHDEFCRQLDEAIGSDEQWIELSNNVACVLAGKRSAEFHRQRCEQLARRLSEHRYSAVSTQHHFTLGSGLCLLTSDCHSANQALLRAEQDFENKLPTNTPTAAAPEPAELRPTPAVLEPTPATATFAPAADFSQLVFSRDLSLAFQPIISLEDSRIEHFSVLLRLTGAEGEAIAAKQFLSRITQPAQRVELDRWVLQQAVNAIANNSATREQATLFVHLAEDTLQQTSFFSFAANVLRSSRLRGTERLVFMLEEAWVVNHLHQAQEISRALHEIHCGICLNHAGEHPQTGQLLEHLALDYLRLSPKLTNTDAQTGQLAQLLQQASERGIEVIATQIEDSRNLSSLWIQGVRLFEGFFIQPPDAGFHLQNDIVFAKEFVQEHGFSH